MSVFDEDVTIPVIPGWLCGGQCAIRLGGTDAFEDHHFGLADDHWHLGACDDPEWWTCGRWMDILPYPHSKRSWKESHPNYWMGFTGKNGNF